jgi:predicted double-glycine peptidase
LAKQPAGSCRRPLAYARGSLAAAAALAGALFAGEAGVWIDAPFVEQTRNACGAANAAMLLRYWSAQGARLDGADASLEALHERLYSAEQRGTLGSELAKLLEESGLRTFVFEGRYEDLEEHLAKGRPLVVCLKPRGQSRLHFALAVGLDPGADVVLLNDPARRKLSRVDRAGFLESWRAAGSWTLLAIPRESP